MGLGTCTISLLCFPLLLAQGKVNNGKFRIWWALWKTRDCIIMLSLRQYRCSLRHPCRRIGSNPFAHFNDHISLRQLLYAKYMEVVEHDQSILLISLLTAWFLAPLHGLRVIPCVGDLMKLGVCDLSVPLSSSNCSFVPLRRSTRAWVSHIILLFSYFLFYFIILFM